MKRKQITKHFSYAEMTHTDTGLPNKPDARAEIHLVYLCRALERIRDKVGMPLMINSAFRSPAVNDAVGGSKHSYHLDGRAADISTLGMDDSQLDALHNAIDDEFPSEKITYQNFVHFAI